MSGVCTRFAPSPTGYLHVGGARTALFCYLLARAKKGTFILRIEDTDQERSAPEFEQVIYNDLSWLGLNWDQGPFRQSDRLSIYRQVLEDLLKSKKAYHCFCSDELLEQKRQIAIEKNEHPHYDGTCFHLTPKEVEEKKEQNIPYSYRFRVIQKNYTFEDAVRGSVSFPEFMVGDFVIMRSNGYPVYNFSCVIDDWKMNVTDCIRAEEHLPNTLRQLMLYEALGATPPTFAHVSLLVGIDRQKLSKRHGATSVEQYRQEGFLPQALVNYLTLLGWSHPQEVDIFSPEEILPYFDLSRFSKSPAVFDEVKLRWMNGQYIKKMDKVDLYNLIVKFLGPENFFCKQNKEWQMNILELLAPKMETLKDLSTLIIPFMSSDFTPDEEFNTIMTWETTGTIKKFLSEKLKIIQGEYINLEEFDQWAVVLKNEHKIKGAPLFKGLRALLTGAGHGSDLRMIVQLTPKAIFEERLTRIS